MDINTSREHYSIILKTISHNNKIDDFLEYFESTWFPVKEGDNTKFEFDLWNYANKFNFKGNKKQLIKNGELDKYILFSNNAVESFNHLMNQCIDSNS